MPRVHCAQFGLETGMFSVQQMHPEIVLRLAASTSVGGLARAGMGLQTMITEYGGGLVIVGAEVDYRQPLTFFAGPAVAAEATVSLRADGRLLLFHVQLGVAAIDAIVVRVRARPIALSGGPALDAAPAAVADGYRALFADDEIVPARELPSRTLRAMTQRWMRDGEPIGTGQHPVYIGRTDCELADQWLFSRLPSLVATARERLLPDQPGELTVSLRQPLRSFHSEYFRPMYFGDEGQIEMTAYRSGERTFFVYRVLGASVPGGGNGDRPLSALAVEVY